VIVVGAGSTQPASPAAKQPGARRAARPEPIDGTWPRRRSAQRSPHQTLGQGSPRSRARTAPDPRRAAAALDRSAAMNACGSSASALRNSITATSLASLNGWLTCCSDNIRLITSRCALRWQTRLPALRSQGLIAHALSLHLGQRRRQTRRLCGQLPQRSDAAGSPQPGTELEATVTARRIVWDRSTIGYWDDRYALTQSHGTPSRTWVATSGCTTCASTPAWTCVKAHRLTSAGVQAHQG